MSQAIPASQITISFYQCRSAPVTQFTVCYHGGDSKALASLKNTIETDVNFISTITSSKTQAAVTVRASVYCCPNPQDKTHWRLSSIIISCTFQKIIKRQETKHSDELFKSPRTGQVLSREHHVFWLHMRRKRKVGRTMKRRPGCSTLLRSPWKC